METSVAYIWADLREELKKFILSKVEDPFQAEDILQEVFIKVHLHLHQLKDPNRLTSWTYQICRNVIIDHFNDRQRARRQQGIPFPPESEQGEPLYLALSDCVNGKIARLSPRERDAILLTYFQNYSQKQLAEFLGMSYSGTKNRIRRTRDKLRRDILNCERVESDSRGRPVTWNGEQ